VRSRRLAIGSVNRFLLAIRQHRWDTSLPADAALYPEDYPKQSQPAPRALPEPVMAQVEHPDNLARLQDPAVRLLMLILLRTGLRVGDGARLAFDCVVRDPQGAPYLRYWNHKMDREAAVPIDEDLAGQIRAQQQRVLARWPEPTVLLPRQRANPDGRWPLPSSTYRVRLNRWLAACEVRDEHGRRVHLTPHQWRHTFATRLLNLDVPQEVVRVLLNHDSHAMTAHYARLHDQTVRRHWEQARKVNIAGQQVALDPDGPLADAAWANDRLARAKQTLSNGYCGLPLQQTCPHANACLTCPVFITTPQFLPQHHQQREHTRKLIATAQAGGQARVVEMNRQVLGNLERIITALEANQDPTTAGRRPVRADNSHHLRAAARRRAVETRDRAVRALRRLDATGRPVTIQTVAREAGVSRSWLYGQADLRAEIQRLGSRSRPSGSAPPIPVRQRASDASLRRRLEAVNAQIAYGRRTGRCASGLPGHSASCAPPASTARPATPRPPREPDARGRRRSGPAPEQAVSGAPPAAPE
jgi:integrase